MCFIQEEERLLSSYSIHRNSIERWEGDKVKKSHKKSHGKVTFQVLSRLIGQRWRDLHDGDEKSYYFDLAKKDMERYK